jgi:ubiquinone/menaquinone biosynthesis C-methylase UbiE
MLDRLLKENNRRRSTMKHYLVSQFGHPRSVVGSIVGILMSRKNRDRSDWAVDRLAVREEDVILEVGAGPGVTLQSIVQRVPAGFVAGIDHSPTMIRQARKRNREGITAGKIEVLCASVDAIPFPDNHFDKVFTINSMMFWPDRNIGLREVKRVLKPRGKLSVFYQPHGAKTTAQVGQQGERILNEVRAAGFEHPRMLVQEMKPVACTLVEGEKPEVSRVSEERQ